MTPGAALGGMLKARMGRVLSRPKVCSLHRPAACRGSTAEAKVAPAGLVHKARPFQPLQQGKIRQRSRQRVVPEALAANLDGLVSVVQTPPVRDLAAAAFAVVGAKVLVRFFYWLETQDLISQNTSRKLVHTIAGPAFVACWPLFSDAPYARYIATIVPLLNLIRVVLVGSGVWEDKRAVMAMSRSGDPSELLRGPLYYCVVLIMVSSIYWRNSSVGLIITSLMCGGDGLADLAGRRWGGTNRLPWNPRKSWAGSLAMLFGGFGFSMAFITLFRYLGYIDFDLTTMAATVAVISLAATAVESLPTNDKVDDNLTVPGVAAFMGIFLLQVAVEFL